MASTKEQKLAAAKSCFEFNTDSVECFVTDDLTCFTNKNNAANHASGLEVKTIDHFVRSTDPIADPENVSTDQPGTTSENPSADRTNNPDAPEKTDAPEAAAPIVVNMGDAQASTEGKPAADEPTATEEQPATATETQPAAETVEAAPAAETAEAAPTHEDVVKHIVEEIVDEVEEVFTGKKGTK